MTWTPQQIKAFRTALKLDQVQFALAVGFGHPTSISRWESGRAKPSRMSCALLEKLANQHGWVGEPADVTEPTDSS